nr:MAG TPA: hypothetical protein [Caudoviricetes sp.]
MKGSTIKVKLTSDSYKKWIKWQKNFGELLTRAEQERETGFLLIINVKRITDTRRCLDVTEHCSRRRELVPPC